MTEQTPRDLGATVATSAPEWGKTLRLPRTSFAMRANLAAREPDWVQRWLDEGLYDKLLKQRREAGAPTYIVHLGPPYANGNFHMGHLLTYVLKDLVVRHKFMAGFAAPYVPGWDCHGLPIEWKIETELREQGQGKKDIPLTELRARCRAYAQKWSEIQLTEWQRLGALADWQRPYRTMDKANEAGIVGALGQMVQRGLVYNKLRSTLWAPVEETALAEAEIEYDENYKSTAVYVALPIIGRENEHLVIWTTTPWTLPANRAVAVKGDEDYLLISALRDEGDWSVGNEPLKFPFSKFVGKSYWIAKERFEDFKELFSILAIEGGLQDWKIIKESLGKELLGLTYQHPIYADRTGTVYHGDHVTTDSGTGMVHIAPAHGPEDYDIGVCEGLELACPVDGAGRYEAWAEAGLPEGLTLQGRSVLDKAVTADILTALGDKLLHSAVYPHKYPISWRSKAPVIYRTTYQWFIDLDKAIPQLGGQTVRQRSLDLIHGTGGAKQVNWVPKYGENRIGSMIAGRPDWCISRQRAWGVPITIMVDKATGEPLADASVWAHIEALVAAEGIDAWDTRLGGREAELFPNGWLAAQGKTPANFTYVRDILDVWFDSGTTWRHVVQADSAPGQRFSRNGDGKRVADLYQEGSDQHRGWFHSSLLTSVALTGDAPYENVVTSGFVVDGQGRKFSKSLGNGVAPESLLNKYGMDILRLWVASADYSEDIRYSEQILEGTADTYRKLRNVLRWLLGNLPEEGGAVAAVAQENLPELERYVLHQLGTTLAAVRADYDAFQFHAGLRKLVEFCTSTLSNFYFDVRKDVLYCDAANSTDRVACVYVLDEIFKGLVTHLAPLAPFTTDEAWRCRYGEDMCVHLGRFNK
jgi:isoleucyl-tRNA synthetase